MICAPFRVQKGWFRPAHAEENDRFGGHRMIPAADTKTLVERAAALVPTLRERAAASESARRLPPETFDALSEADIFRMTAPKRYGGYEA